MATKQVQIRRGTASQCDSIIPVEGELLVDTTNDRIRVGDGTLQGGYHITNSQDIQNQEVVYAQVGGTANTITLTLSPAPTSYTEGMAIEFKAAGNNVAGGVSVNINGLGSTSLQGISSSGSIGALEVGAIRQNYIYRIVYDGTRFLLVSSSGQSVTASGGIVKNVNDISLDTNNALGIGSTQMLALRRGGSGTTTIAFNGTITIGSTAGYIVNAAIFTANSGNITFVPGGTLPNGSVWRNVTGSISFSSTAGDVFAMFQRVS